MEKTTNSSIGERLKSVRQKMGWSQKSIAEYLSISTNYWSAIERGVKQPSIQLVRRVAELTGVDFEWIEKDADLNVTRVVIKTARESEMLPNMPFHIMHAKERDLFIDILKQTCAKICRFSEPGYNRIFFENAGEPDDENVYAAPTYWIHIHDEPIHYWCFDMCLERLRNSMREEYNPPMYDFMYSYAHFLTHILQLEEGYRNNTKYSFVVNQQRLFDAFPQFSFPLGNLSLILLDPVKKRVLKERYICRVGDDELMASLDRLHFEDAFEEPNEQIKMLSQEEHEALTMQNISDDA